MKKKNRGEYAALQSQKALSKHTCLHIRMITFSRGVAVSQQNATEDVKNATAECETRVTPTQ